MSGWWAFAGGMADTLRSDMMQRQASEDEMAAFERKLKLQQQLQMEDEDRRRKNESIAQGVDPATGEFYEKTRGGQETRVQLPQAAMDKYRAEQEAAAAAAEREQQNFEAGLSRTRAQTEANQARAGASKAQAARYGTLSEYDRARAEAEKNKPPKAASGGLRDSDVQSNVESIYNRLTKPDENGVRNESIAAQAAAIYSSDAPLAERQTQLRKLESSRFAMPGSSPDKPVSASSLSSEPTTPTWVKLPNGKIILVGG